jgi:hypothetical protein
MLEDKRRHLFSCDLSSRDRSLVRRSADGSGQATEATKLARRRSCSLSNPTRHRVCADARHASAWIQSNRLATAVPRYRCEPQVQRGENDARAGFTASLTVHGLKLILRDRREVKPTRKDAKSQGFAPAIANQIYGVGGSSVIMR